jgi:hypothetical protein
MKKLLLLCIPVLSVAGLQVWSQALAEPEPVHRPGVVVPGVIVASPAAHLQGPYRSSELRRGPSAVTGTSDFRADNGR